MNDKDQSALTIKIGLACMLVMSVLAFLPIRRQFIIFANGVPGTKYWYTEMAGWAVLALLFGLVVYAFAAGAGHITQFIQRSSSFLSRIRPLSLLIFAALLASYPLLLHGRYYHYFTSIFTRYWLLAIFILVGGLLIKSCINNIGWGVSLLTAALTIGYAYLIAGFIPQISTYPFSLGWSETSRFYHASLWLDKWVYGIDLPLPHRDFSRYFMQAVPFLLPHSHLWLHRFWESLMRLSLPVLTAWLLARRLGIGEKKEVWLFALWGALYLRQGPVFYQMLAVVIPLFLWFNSRKTWRSTLLVLLVSIWAGITRVNWFPVPGLLAALFYIIEQPVPGRKMKDLLRYPLWPLAWTISGSLVAWGSQNYYHAHSGLPAHMFATTYTADMLWYRLLPNVNFQPGVLTGTLLICAPLLAYILISFRGWRARWHPLRLVGIGGILLGLFAGCLVVSVKVGGGANLHNMDSFMVGLLMLAGYLYRGIFAQDEAGTVPTQPGRILLALIVLAPVMFHVVQVNEPYPQRNFSAAADTLQELQDYIDEYASEPGVVLFIAERHLITFGSINNVPLIHDYEKIVLMEMALGNNREYLSQFEQDLKNHRFSLIVTDIISDRYKEPQQFVFAEENNIHAERVVRPLLCEYRPLERLKVAGIQLWVPRKSSTCP